MNKSSKEYAEDDYELSKEIQYWAGRLIGFDQDYIVAEEVVQAIEYAEKRTEVEEKEREIERLKIIESQSLPLAMKALGDSDTRSKQKDAQLKEMAEALSRQLDIIYENDSIKLLLTEKELEYWHDDFLILSKLK